MTTEQPVIRLKPKTSPQRLRHGFPWVYDNELVTDRRTRNIEAGSLVTLTDHAQNSLGLFAFNFNSKIIARRIAFDPDTKINTAWLIKNLTVDTTLNYLVSFVFWIFEPYYIY